MTAIHTLEEEHAAAFAELLEHADSLADATEVERLLCMSVLPLDDPELPDGSSARVVAALERQGAPAAALLAGAELLGTPRLRDQASAALRRLRARECDLRVPAGLGQARLCGAVALRSGEADYYVLSLARPGDPRVQVAMVVVEQEQSAGALVEGILAVPAEPTAAERVRESIIAQAPRPLACERPAPAEVRAALIAAAERTRELDLAVDFELAAWLPLLSLAVTGDAQALGRLRPAAPEPPLELGLFVDPMDREEFEQMADVILADYAQEPPAGKGARGARELPVAESMLEFRWSRDGLLAHWTAGDVEEYLLDHAPRRLRLPGEAAEQIVDSVNGFLEFLDDAGALMGDSVGTLTRVATCLRSEAARAARDPRRWSPAKTLFMQAAAEGVDVADAAALAAWMDEFNSRPSAERDRILGPVRGGATGEARRAARGGRRAVRRRRRAARAARARSRR